MDIKSRQAETGAYFRAVRQGLGLSLRDVAVPPLSYSQLSRFERGDSDISTENAVQLMSALGMNRDDVRIMQRANSYTFPTDLVDSVMFGDTDRITQQVKRYTAAHADNPATTMHDITRIILTCAQQDIGSDYQIGIAAEHTIITFLMYPESWKIPELTAIAVLAPFTSQEFRAVLAAARALRH